jgi:prevent-host-death family protein
MVTITAAELQKQFGRYREAAIREPVSVTHHGRESLVMLSADEYKRLKALIPKAGSLSTASGSILDADPCSRGQFCMPIHILPLQL